MIKLILAKNIKVKKTYFYFNFNFINKIQSSNDPDFF